MHVLAHLMLGSVVTAVRLSDKTKQLAHTSPSSPQESSKTCGVCIAGLARTFPVPALYKRQVKNVIGPLKQDGWDTSVFLYLASVDDPRGAGGHGVSLDGLDRAIAAFEPTGSKVITQDPPVPKNIHCHQNCMSSRDFPRWYHQWDKIGGCYDLLTKAEKNSGRQFSYLLKMRADLFITNPIVPSQIFVDGKLVVPRNLVSHGSAAVNDWFTGCSRQACDPYFRVTSRWTSCHGSFKYLSSHAISRCDNSESLLYSHLLSHKVNIREESIVMTIMPTCGGVACSRISRMCPFSDKTLCAQLAAECVKESENVTCNVDDASYERFAEQAEVRASPEEIRDFIKIRDSIHSESELQKFMSSE